MSYIECDIEPPGLDTDADDDVDPYTAVHVLIGEHDGTRRAGYGAVPAEGTDTDVAALLIDAVRAVAAARGPGLATAVEHHLTEPPGDTRMSYRHTALRKTRRRARTGTVPYGYGYPDAPPELTHRFAAPLDEDGTPVWDGPATPTADARRVAARQAVADIAR